MVRAVEQVRRIRNEFEAQALAHRLLVPGLRTKPAVVLSTPSGQVEPYADVEAIVTAVGDRAEIFILPTGSASWAFSSEMPPDTQVYGGAGRVYPVDHDWVQRPTLSRLRFAYGFEHRVRITEQLIEDVLRFAPREKQLGERRVDKWIDPRDERIDELQKEVERLQERYRTLDRARLKLAKQLKSATDRAEQDNGGGPYFVDPEEQFRFEVYVEWVRRIPAGEKSSTPLAEFFLGPEFLASLDRVEGISREKVVAVVVEVLTGLANTMMSRDMHPLRQADGPASPVVTRADGGVCWRVAIQREAPSARRLHFWRVQDWYELSRVVVHEDYRP